MLREGYVNQLQASTNSPLTVPPNSATPPGLYDSTSVSDASRKQCVSERVNKKYLEKKYGLCVRVISLVLRHSLFEYLEYVYIYIYIDVNRYDLQTLSSHSYDPCKAEPINPNPHPPSSLDWNTRRVMSVFGSLSTDWNTPAGDLTHPVGY